MKWYFFSILLIFYSTVQAMDSMPKAVSKFLCEEKDCGKTYKNKNSLTRHAKIHLNINFPCQICKEVFSYKTNLKRHHDTAHKDCKLEDVQSCISKIHIRHFPNKRSKKASQKRPFICDICKNSYKKKSYLKEHAIIHSTFRFSCTDCKRLFRYSKNLKQHRQYVCKKIPKNTNQETQSTDPQNHEETSVQQPNEENTPLDLEESLNDEEDSQFNWKDYLDESFL